MPNMRVVMKGAHAATGEWILLDYEKGSDRVEVVKELEDHYHNILGTSQKHATDPELRAVIRVGSVRFNPARFLAISIFVN